MDIEDYSNGCLSVEFRHLVRQLMFKYNINTGGLHITSPEPLNCFPTEKENLH